MQSNTQFEAVKKEFQLTENDMQKLKRELMYLRAEFVQNTGINQAHIDPEELLHIEQKIYSIEHQLAHAAILQDAIREEDLLDRINDTLIKRGRTIMAHCKHIFYQLAHHIDRTYKNRAHKAE